jgi:hypothetical protein
MLPTDANGNCSCPITAGDYVSGTPVTMELPDFGSLIGSLLTVSITAIYFPPPYDIYRL